MTKKDTNYFKVSSRKDFKWTSDKVQNIIFLSKTSYWPIILWLSFSTLAAIVGPLSIFATFFFCCWCFQ